MAYKFIFWVGLLVLLPFAAHAQPSENDMVDGARTGSLGLMERGFINGLSVNMRDRIGNPVLIVAAMGGQLDAVRYLIARGVRVDDRGIDERTALTVATERGDVKIMTALLEAGADIDRSGIRKQVPIIIAAREGHIEAVRLLIEKGAYLEDTDLTGRTALDWAREGRNPKLVQLLESAGP